MAIKLGNNNITFKVGSTDVDAIYLGSTLMYSGGTPPTPTGQTPTFAVIQDIQSYTATTYNKVYSTSDNKWYMLNNLNQYEEYGIYDVSGSSLSDYTYYEGKLVAIGTTEYQYSGGSWVEVGTYEDTSVTYTIDDSDPSPYVGQTLSTTFKIPTTDIEAVGWLDMDIRTSDDGRLNVGTDQYRYYGSTSEQGTITSDADYYYYSMQNIQSVVIDRIDYWSSTPIHLIVGSKQVTVEYIDIDKPFGIKSFSSIADADSYADKYYGMAAHIASDYYVFSTANTWSQVTQTQANYFSVKTSSVGLEFTNKASSGSLYVSYDLGNNWYETNSLLAVDSGNTVMFKGDLIPNYGNGIGQFSNNVLEVQGNAMSLIYGDNFEGQTDLSGKVYAFANLFSGCTTITSAENMILPATTLANDCYVSMFQGCTSLTTTPQLLATTLATRCYQYMFRGCTSLTTAPQLSATVLASYCYSYMFQGCTSLTTAPQLPATTLADYCYRWMFYNCTSLTTAPELPATTLTNSCYDSMFFGCTSLTSITCLATNISASSCTYNWVSSVAANGTFTKAASMTSWTTGKNGIPSGWTVQDYAG